ncbi:CLUMA_CG013420, isoform A [Clunio marinus]|uniref:CLUMA_CG013420, isoform A n=2 Tax=Clunio marinus TaxID=568069 RepID=A0A1J1IIS3_9DIPT|nr:CLUMA_CG013420, isoform A [Clunio marinus]
MDFDSHLNDVGSFGLYQKVVICFILLPAMLPCAFHAYSQIFIAAKPDHFCKIPEFEPWMDHYQDILKNLSIPLERNDGVEKYCGCKMYNRNYSDLSRLWLNKTPDEILINHKHLLDESKSYEIINCQHGWNYDKTIFPATVISEWNLVCEKDYYATMALVIFGISGLIGNYIFGYLQDYYGRKPSFYIYLLLEITACAISAFAWNFSSWMALRFIVGLTVPAILASPYVLAIEMVGPDRRVFCTIVSNIAYSIGLTSLAGVVYMFREWRQLSLAVSLPLIVLFLFYFSLPESPRWLIATHKFERASEIMKTIARFNGKTLPQNYEVLLKEQSLAYENMQNLESTERRNYGIFDLFATNNMTRKTIIITFIWFCITSVYVGLSYYAPSLGGDEIFNFFLAGACELPTYIFLWPSLSYFGRRWILCISMIIGGAACLATFLAQHDQTTTLILYCIGKMGISSAFVVLPLMASELYPTVVRGLGMSFSQVVAMIGPTLIPIVNYMGSEMIVMPLIIMGILLIFGGLASFFLPETKNKSLPQTIHDSESVPLVNPFKVFKNNKQRHTIAMHTN